MDPSKERILCNLKSARKAKGLSQSELAERIGVKRQAIYDMETGKYVPNTAIALRMAKELGCGVEDLFALEDAGESQPVTLVETPEAGSARVSVTRVGERLVAYPLDGKWLFSDGIQPADGLLSAESGRVQLFHTCPKRESKILLLGCDPAFALLGAHASRWSADAQISCRFASSRLALERLASGHAHIAGTHLHNPTATEANISFARKIIGGARAKVIAFSFFEEGLMVAPGNPFQIRTVADLAGPKIRFVNREPGAALRMLLDERLTQAGLTGTAINGYETIALNHSRCAQAVACNMADAALGLRAVAAAYGLDFVPMEAVRCDLVIPYDFLEFPAIKILLDVLQTRSLKKELSVLPGYEAACTGTVIGDV